MSDIRRFVTLLSCLWWRALGLAPKFASGQKLPISSQDMNTQRRSATDRMTPERNAVIASILLGETRLIGAKLNPFDPTLRRAGAAMEMVRDRPD